MFVRGPGIAPGSHISALALNTDIAPTLAALAGVQVPDFVDGRSLLPLLLGPAPTRWRDVILLEHFRNGEEEDGNEPMYNPPSFEGVRSATWKYVEYGQGDRELYDLTKDPGEMENQYRQNPEQAKILAARLEKLRNCAGQGCRDAEDGL
jgi:arylsulfatase A-like enzyme